MDPRVRLPHEMPDDCRTAIVWMAKTSRGSDEFPCLRNSVISALSAELLDITISWAQARQPSSLLVAAVPHSSRTDIVITCLSHLRSLGLVQTSVVLSRG